MRGIPTKQLAAAAVAAACGCAALAPAASASGTAFNPVGGSPSAGTPVASGDAGDNAIQFNPSGTLAAVTNWGAQSTTIETVAAGGVLTPTGNTVAISEPILAEFSPNGAYLAIFSYNRGIYVYSVGAGGALTMVGGSPFSSVAGYGMAWSPSGDLLATVGNGPNGDGIAIYSVAPDGALSAVSGAFDSGNPIAVAFSPDGGLLAVANQNAKTVGLYSVGAGAALTHLTDYSTGASSDPYWVAFNPLTGSGTAQLALADYSDNAVDLFAASGAGLTLESSTSTGPGSGPRYVAYSPDGLVATADAGNGSVSVFQLSPANALTPLPGSPMVSGVTPTVVAFTADGGTLAASNEYGNTIAAFSVAAPTLSLTTPVNGGVYGIDQRVQIGFSCSDGPFAPGLSYCGAPGQSSDTVPAPQYLATGALGSFSISEAVASRDGQSATATAAYRVVAPAVGIAGRLRAHGRRAQLELACRGGIAGQACRGTVALSSIITLHPRHRRRRRVELVLGRARYRLLRGRRRTVAVRLSARVARLVESHHGRALEVSVAATTTGLRPVHRRLRLTVAAHAGRRRRRH